MQDIVRPGLLMLDANFNLIAFNSEAIEILTFPAPPTNHRRAGAVLMRQIKTRLGEIRAASHPSFMKEFRSGKRTYLCHLCPLDVRARSEMPQAILLILVRRSNGAIATIQALKQFGLTLREITVVQLLLRGLTSQQIAREMKISPNTVKAFIRLVMLKMHVSSRAGILGKVIGASHSS